MGGVDLAHAAVECYNVDFHLYMRAGSKFKQARTAQEGTKAQEVS